MDKRDVLQDNYNLVPASGKSSQVCSTPGRESLSKQTITYVKRFALKVAEAFEADPQSCIVLQSPKYYHRIGIAGRYVRGSRFVFELFHGPLPEGLFACHTCDMPACVNPSHLFAGTDQDNSDDKLAKGRQAKGPTNSQTVIPFSTVQAIREGRNKQGLSYNVLARTFGVSPRYIRELLKGLYRISC